LGHKHQMKRKDRNVKKQMRESKLPIMSSGGETGHYIKRSIQRRESGALLPYSRRQIEKMIAAGEVDIRKAGRQKTEIFFRNGVRMIVSKNFKKAITYI